MIRVQDVIDAMAAIAPPALALDGDPIGLHAGDRRAAVKRITLALDASLAAVEAAVKNRSQMLVVHHPRFYRGLSTLAEDDASGRRAAAIVRSGLAVFSAHTNLDMAAGGTNDLLAEAAGLREARIVKVEKSEPLIKLAVFVPSDHLDKVLRAVCAAGAGAIGNYSDCTFRTRGTGTFRCGEGTTPFIGKPGSYEEADEYRLETVFGEHVRERVVAAMLAAHPYEEVAYDLYPLLGQARRYGFGRVGELARPEKLAAFARRLAKATGSTMTQFHGKSSLTVRRPAVWAGAGVEAKPLIVSGADVVVAGEMGYHDVETFSDSGVAVVTLGHGFSEELVLAPLKRRLSALKGVNVGIAARHCFGMKNV